MDWSEAEGRFGLQGGRCVTGGGIRVWARTKLGWKKRRRVMPAVLDGSAEEAVVGQADDDS